MERRRCRAEGQASDRGEEKDARCTTKCSSSALLFDTEGRLRSSVGPNVKSASVNSDSKQEPLRWRHSMHGLAALGIECRNCVVSKPKAAQGLSAKVRRIKR